MLDWWMDLGQRGQVNYAMPLLFTKDLECSKRFVPFILPAENLRESKTSHLVQTYNMREQTLILFLFPVTFVFLYIYHHLAGLL